MKKHVRILIGWLVVCLCCALPGVAILEEKPARTLEDRIQDPSTDIRPLVSLLENGFGRNLLQWQTDYDLQALTIEAGEEQRFAFRRLYSELENDFSYIFILGKSQVLRGSPAFVRASLYDFNAEKVIMTHDFEPNRDVPQAWCFTVPPDVDTSNLYLLIYAGESGKTSGNTMLYSDLRLYLWMPGIQETAVAEGLEERDLASELENPEAVAQWINNPALDTRPLLDLYEQKGKRELLSASAAIDPSGFILKAGENSPYHYQSLFGGLEPGKSYLFSVGSVQNLEGEAQEATLRVYSYANENAATALSLRTDHLLPQTRLFTLSPEDGPGHLSLLLYAGKADETDGNSLRFEDLRLYEWDGDEEDVQAILGLAQLSPDDIQTAQVTEDEADEPLLAEGLADPIRIDAGESETYAAVTLSRAFKEGKTYVLAIDSIDCLAGEVDHVTVRVVNLVTNETVMRRTARIGAEEFNWQFTIPRDQNAADIALLVYAGIVGRTQGNSIELDGVTLTRVTLAE